MTEKQTKAIQRMRERYLGENSRTYKKPDRITLFEEIRDMAVAAGVSAWEKFADATLFWLQKDMEAALSLFDEVIALDPEFAYPWNGKGLVLRALQRYDEAITAYDKAIALEPEFAYPWNNKGNVLINLKRYEEAMAACEKAIALDPEYAYPWNGKGNTLYGQNRYDEAMAAYDKAIAINPEFANPWNGKGYALDHLKRYKEAVAAQEKAIALNPENANPWNGKGNALGNLKRYEEALAAYEKAIALDPEYDHPHYNLGLLHWEQERPDDAVKAFRRAIELGLDPKTKEMAESWIARANGMLESKKARKPKKERQQKDRSSDEALITDLHEAMKGDLPDIEKKKEDFEKQMKASVGRPRIIGAGGADDILLVLRDWNSYSPILRRDLRNEDGPGPDERLGGGYFLTWKGHGIVIDPGTDFVTQLYRKGLSIADVDTIIVTHCHLDHIRDLESLVDLNYRHNRAKESKPRPGDDDFRQIQFKLCQSAAMKYDQYLKASGCCKKPTHLDSEGNPWPISEFIDVLAVPVKHSDINGSDDETIGLVLALKGDDGEVTLRVGFTSDSRWFKELPDGFADCDVLVAHLGTIEAGEPGNPDFLKTDLKNHLGTKGCFRLMHGVKPKLFVMGEFGEELVETRLKILQVFNKNKPDETRFVLGGDSNLAIELGENLSVYCSHPQCAILRTPIELDKVRPILGGDFLFQYTCSEHGLEPG